ncbi:MAG: response regulator transcription factor [Flavobacteriaceae bacterium]|nr:response regulator transcription factor [Flavobacteriaceae bacterium]
MKEKIKVHVADDHMILIEGIIAMLNTDSEIEVVGHSLTGLQVVEWFKTNKADILVLDINMPELDGIEVLKRFNKKALRQKIIMLSSYDDVKLVQELTTYGADGFISKTSAGEHIVKAIKSVQSGIPYFSDDIKEGLFNLAIGQNVAEGNRPDATPEDASLISELTDREIEVLKLVASEYSTPEIADQLLISTNTVETYRKKLLKKLKVKNAVGLAMFAVKHRMI